MFDSIHRKYDHLPEETRFWVFLFFVVMPTISAFNLGRYASPYAFIPSCIWLVGIAFFAITRVRYLHRRG